MFNSLNKFLQDSVTTSHNNPNCPFKALYSCCLFYDAFSNSDYTESNVVVTGKSERSGKKRSWTNQASPASTEENYKLSQLANGPTDIQMRHLINTSLKWCRHINPLCKTDKAGVIMTLYELQWKGHDSVVSTATRCVLDGSGIDSWWERDFLLPARPALGTTQPPVK
jgi:hypothetical protein